MVFFTLNSKIHGNCKINYVVGLKKQDHVIRVLTHNAILFNRFVLVLRMLRLNLVQKWSELRSKSFKKCLGHYTDSHNSQKANVTRGNPSTSSRFQRIL